jgi:hypothetical protein
MVVLIPVSVLVLLLVVAYTEAQGVRSDRKLNARE